MFNDFDELILDTFTVFLSYFSLLYLYARQRSQYYKILQTIELRLGVAVFLNTTNDLGGFDIISNPSNYIAYFIVQYLDEIHAHVMLFVAAKGYGNPSFLYDPI
jgi:hypothetical protein